MTDTDIAIRREPLGRLNRLVWWLASRENRIATNIARVVFHVELPTGCPPVRMPHPFNIFVNKSTRIGSNVTLYQNVTIGSCQFGNRVGSPDVWDDVVVYPGACVIGKVVVGLRAVIGAGAVVTSHIKDNTVAVGSPATMLARRNSDGYGWHHVRAGEGNNA